MCIPDSGRRGIPCWDARGVWVVGKMTYGGKWGVILSLNVSVL